MGIVRTTKNALEWRGLWITGFLRFPAFEDGKPAGEATRDYLPGAVRDAVADLKNMPMTGQFADAKIVMIENLQVNVIKNEAGAVVNAYSGASPVDKSSKTIG